MNIILFMCLLALCLSVLIEGLINARIYQYPFLASAVFLGFIITPILGLFSVDDLPDWGVERFIIMSILSIGAIWLGDKSARQVHIKNRKNIELDPKRWFIGSAVLVFIGMVAYIKWRILFQSEYEVTTGSTVAMNFFVEMLRYGFIMSLICYFKTKNAKILILVGICAVYYFEQIVLAGRRQVTIEVLFVILGSMWFIQKYTPPKILVLVGVVVLTILNFSTGAYREVVVSAGGERDWKLLREIDWFAGVGKVVEEGSSEVQAAIYYMAGIAQERGYDFGFNVWNDLVFNYVPAQIVGEEVKESLYLPLPKASELAEIYWGFNKNVGSTLTGMTDCYGSYWYFGVIKFYIIAYIMQLLYRYGCEGNVVSQMLYLFFMNMALHSITHHTSWFIRPWVHVVVFWLPVIYWSRKK